MYLSLKAFILMLSAYILGEFLFQWPGMRDEKNKGKVFAFILHGFIVFMTMLVLTAYWINGFWIGILAGISIVHIGIDWGRAVRQRKHAERMFLFELLDLAAHVAVIAVAATLFLPESGIGDQHDSVFRFFLSSKFVSTLLYAAAIVFLTEGGTLLVRRLLDQIGKSPAGKNRGITRGALGNQQTGVSNAEAEYNVGKIIGNLERLLLFILVCVNSFSAIGFVIAAKSVARFKDLEDHHFAEYYLVGTLSSSLVAIVSALVVRQLLKAV